MSNLSYADEDTPLYVQPSFPTRNFSYCVTFQTYLEIVEIYA